MIDETLLEAEEKMEKAVSVAKDELQSVRTGRASRRVSSITVTPVVVMGGACCSQQV